MDKKENEAPQRAKPFATTAGSVGGGASFIHSLLYLMQGGGASSL